MILNWTWCTNGGLAQRQTKQHQFFQSARSRKCTMHLRVQGRKSYWSFNKIYLKICGDINFDGVNLPKQIGDGHPGLCLHVLSVDPWDPIWKKPGRLKAFPVWDEPWWFSQRTKPPAGCHCFCGFFQPLDRRRASLKKQKWAQYQARRVV